MTLPVKPCPRARYHSGRKHKHDRRDHVPHEWWAGEYLPVGDLAYRAKCLGWRDPAKPCRAEQSHDIVLIAGK